MILAGLVGVVCIATQILPAVQGLYERRNAEIENVLLAVEREARLIEDSLLWRDRRIEAEVQQAQVENQIFIGATVPLVEANLQRDLSKHARDSGLSVSSTRLADSLEADEWLMVSQEMSFRTDDAGNTITFLRLLEYLSPVCGSEISASAAVAISTTARSPSWVLRKIPAGEAGNDR